MTMANSPPKKDTPSSKKTPISSGTFVTTFTPISSDKKKHRPNKPETPIDLSSVKQVLTSSRKRKKRTFYTDDNKNQMGRSKENINAIHDDLIAEITNKEGSDKCKCFEILDQDINERFDCSNRDLKGLFSTGGKGSRIERMGPSYDFTCQHCQDEDKDIEVRDAKELVSNSLGRNRIINFDNLQNTISSKLCCKQCASDLIKKQQSILKDQLSQVLNDPQLSEHKETILSRLEKKLLAVEQPPIPVLTVSEKTSGIATTADIQCQHQSDKAPVLKTPSLRRKATTVGGKRHKPSNWRVVHNFLVECSHTDVFSDTYKSKKARNRYSLNVLFILSMLANGNGPMDMSTIIAFLGLPGGKCFANNINLNLCTPIYKKIIELGKESMDEALEEEIKMTIKEKK